METVIRREAGLCAHKRVLEEQGHDIHVCRPCNNPSPVNAGSPCLGLDNETASFSTTISCPGMCYRCMCMHLPTVLT